MRIVVALGGNALLKRGEADDRRGAARATSASRREAMAPVAKEHQLVISHGNGPQVGLLALQGAAYKPDEAYPLDVLGAETEGMIGYMIEQELGNLLPFEVPFATLLTMVEVDGDDPGFKDPTKFVGPVYDKAEADRLKAEKGWMFKQDGDKVAPRRALAAAQAHLRDPADQVAAGARDDRHLRRRRRHSDDVRAGRRPQADRRRGRDRQGSLLGAPRARARCRPVRHGDRRRGGVHRMGHPGPKAIHKASPAAISKYKFPAGSMGPKVDAACHFAKATGKIAAIGALADIEAIVRGEKGTLISTSFDAMTWHG